MWSFLQLQIICTIFNFKSEAISTTIYIQEKWAIGRIENDLDNNHSIFHIYFLSWVLYHNILQYKIWVISKLILKRLISGSKKQVMWIYNLEDLGKNIDQNNIVWSRNFSDINLSSVLYPSFKCDKSKN